MLQRSLQRAAAQRLGPQASRIAMSPLVATRFQSTVPATIVDRGFWRSLIPKPMRKENRIPRAKSNEWNPATFFVVIFLLIGSMSIQMIALRNSFQRYMRQSEVKIGLLREVVEKIQRGEKVDVEQALGTGNPEKEADWEEVLRAIERDEVSKATKKSKPTESETQAPKVTKIEETQSVSGTENTATKPTGSFGNFF